MAARIRQAFIYIYAGCGRIQSVSNVAGTVVTAWGIHTLLFATLIGYGTLINVHAEGSVLNEIPGWAYAYEASNGVGAYGVHGWVAGIRITFIDVDTSPTVVLTIPSITLAGERSG